MNDTIYWAVKLDGASRALLLSKCPPLHTNIFAEHMTVVFKPSDDQDNKLKSLLGSNTVLTVVGEAYDDRGQAVAVECEDKVSSMNNVPHITISCANGTKPVYSNALLQVGTNYHDVAPFALTGTIARFTKRGWET